MGRSFKEIRTEIRRYHILVILAKDSLAVVNCRLREVSRSDLSIVQQQLRLLGRERRKLRETLHELERVISGHQAEWDDKILQVCGNGLGITHTDQSPRKRAFSEGAAH